MKQVSLSRALFAAALVAMPVAAAAQAYPSKPVRIVAGYASLTQPTLTRA